MYRWNGALTVRGRCTKRNGATRHLSKPSLRAGDSTTRLSGAATVALAALKKFGLIHDEGSRDSRTVRLTTLAFDILNLPDEERVIELIQEAALTPPIHRDLWTRYSGELPSDATLRYELVRNRSFTESGAVDFIRQFRETIAYAKLGAGNIDSDGGEGQPGEEDPEFEPDRTTPTELSAPDSERQHRTRKRSPGVLTYTVPMAPDGSSVVVEFPFAPTEDDWEYFIGILNAMKPRLVVPPQPRLTATPSEVDRTEVQ